MEERRADQRRAGLCRCGREIGDDPIGRTMKQCAECLFSGPERHIKCIELRTRLNTETGRYEIFPVRRSRLVPIEVFRMAREWVKRFSPDQLRQSVDYEDIDV